MYFRITIPSLQDGKKDEAISFVKEKVMPEFDGTPGLLTMMAAITGETSGVNLAAYESKDCLLYTSPSPRDMRRPRMPSSA